MATTRKLEMYVMNALEDGQVSDYDALIRGLIAIPNARRYQEVGDRVVAIPSIRTSGRLVFLTVYDGNRTELPLVLNTQSGDTRVQELQLNEVQVTRTHVVVDLETRFVVVEYNHRGAKSSTIGWIIESLAQAELGMDELEFHLAPVVDEEFLDTLDRFSRVRMVSVRLTHPNQDWNDVFVPLFRDLSQESQGRNVEITISAHRNGSLANNSGIMAGLKSMVSLGMTALTNAKVEGIRQGEDELTQVSLAKFIEHQRVTVETGPGGHVDSEDIESKMRTYVLSRRT